MSVLASEMGTSILVLEMFECTSTLSSGPSACGYMYSQKNKSNLLPCFRLWTSRGRAQWVPLDSTYHLIPFSFLDPPYCPHVSCFLLPPLKYSTLPLLFFPFSQNFAISVPKIGISNAITKVISEIYDITDTVTELLSVFENCFPVKVPNTPCQQSVMFGHFS